MALRSYSVLCMPLPLIIIIIQDCSQTFNTYGERSTGVKKCLLNIFCRKCVLNVFNSLGHLLHLLCNIWDCVCVQLTHSCLGDRRDIFIAHVVIIIKSEVSSFHTVVIFFPWLCLRWLYHYNLLIVVLHIPGWLVFVPNTIVQFMMCAYNRKIYSWTHKMPVRQGKSWQNDIAKEKLIPRWKYPTDYHDVWQESWDYDDTCIKSRNARINYCIVKI